MVPVRYRFVDDCETPVSAFLKLRGRRAPRSCSSRPSRAGSAATRSSASARGRCCAGATAALRVGGDGAESASAPDRAPTPPTPTRRSPSTSARFEIAAPEGLPPFAGGAVGFFGYDLVRTVEPLGEPNPDPLGLPDMALMVTDVLVVFDHLRHELTILANAFVDDDGGDRRRLRARRRRRSREVRERLREPVPGAASARAVGRAAGASSRT